MKNPVLIFEEQSENIKEYFTNNERNFLIDLIRKTQVDAWNESNEKAWEEAYCDMEHPDDDNGLEESAYVVVKSSIISLQIH